MSTISRMTTEPSIYIHRVFHTVTQKRVFDVFADLFGYEAIDRVDMVNKFAPSGEEYKRVFVHFRNWPNTTESRIVRDRLISGEKVKIVYDEPWFWLCAASNLPRPDINININNTSDVSRRPYIDMNTVNSVKTDMVCPSTPPSKKHLGNMCAAFRTPGAPRKRLDYNKTRYAADDDNAKNATVANAATDTYDDVMGRAMEARRRTKTPEQEEADTQEMIAICKRLIDEDYSAKTKTKTKTKTWWKPVTKI